MKKITAKQQKILEFIKQFTIEQGYPPSVREIGSAMGLSSPSTVHAHIKNLTELGYIEKNDRKTRALKIAGATGLVERIPILGSVTAGMPILAVEDIEGYMPFDTTGKYGEYFALRIKGDSMIDAGILNGDLVVVKKESAASHGDIVIALLEDEATCKVLDTKSGHIWLMPRNTQYAPIDGEGCVILGVVVAVYREYN